MKYQIRAKYTYTVSIILNQQFIKKIAIIKDFLNDLFINKNIELNITMIYG